MPVVRGLDGAVIVSAPVAAVWAPLLRQALTEATRRDGFRFRPEVWAEVEALEVAAAQLRARIQVVKNVVTTTAPTLSAERLEPGGYSFQETSVTGAAELLGCSRQAVLGRISRRTLPARKDDRGRYRIQLENLDPNGET